LASSTPSFAWHHDVGKHQIELGMPLLQNGQRFARIDRTTG
jgi:hypothetical protein